MNIPIIPVIYYHSIGNHQKPTRWSFLSYNYKLFEKHLLWLHKNNYSTLDLNELYDYQTRKNTIKNKSLVITFDDGFLDNWVFAYPLLKKFNLKATIYVNPDFVDMEGGIRPTLEDVWNQKIHLDDLDWWGYLSWEEMRLMEDSGVIDIQSHSLTHTWYFSSPKIIDFHNPDSKYFWLYWNKFPERKSQWLNEYSSEAIPFGLPVYEHMKSLTVRKYHEDANLNKYLIEFVKNEGIRSFFSRPNWKEILFTTTQEFQRKHSVEHKYETKDEYTDRIKFELSESKKMIETNLNKKVNFLCWPGGGVNQTAFEISKEVGYISTTKGTELNYPGSNANKVSRVSAISPVTPPFFRKKFHILFLRSQINRASGGILHQLINSKTKNSLLKMMQ